MRVKANSASVKIPPAARLLSACWRPPRAKFWIALMIIHENDPVLRMKVERKDRPMAVHLYQCTGNKSLLQLIPPPGKGGELKVVYLPAPVEI